MHGRTGYPTHIPAQRIEEVIYMTLSPQEKGDSDNHSYVQMGLCCPRNDYGNMVTPGQDLKTTI